MATIVGNDGAIRFGANTVINLRNFTCDITADTIETTTMGTDSRTYVRGLAGWSGSADIYVDPANLPAGSASAQISQLITTGGVVGDTPIAFRGNLNSTGSQNLQGTVIITGFSINSTMDGLVEGSISFQGSDAVRFWANV